LNWWLRIVRALKGDQETMAQTVNAQETAHTVKSLLDAQANRRPNAVAIESTDGGRPLMYAELVAQVIQTREALRNVGIERHDRVALLLPDGAAAAVAFLATAANAVAAPLNPASRPDRLALSLDELPARAVIVPGGTSGPIMDVARSHGRQVFELVGRPDLTGRFDLHPLASGLRTARGVSAVATDLALTLDMSVTAARPTFIPLTHRDLVSSACRTAAALELTEADRGLHVMPISRIQGLVPALLAPLSVGGTVVCAPELQSHQFTEWLSDGRATWCAATDATAGIEERIMRQYRQDWTAAY